MSGNEWAERIRQHTSRKRFLEQAVLISALCRELQTEAAQGNFPSARSEAAYWLLQAWRDANGHSDGMEPIEDVAPDLLEEIQLGSAVESDLSMVYSAGLGTEYERDVNYLRESLDRYLRR